MAIKDAFYYKLKFNIEIPSSIYEWMVQQNLDEPAYEKHLAELRQGYGHYCHWRDQYTRLAGTRQRLVESQAVKTAAYIIKTIKDSDISDKDKEYFSVFLKIALDQILEEHWAEMRLGNQAI